MFRLRFNFVHKNPSLLFLKIIDVLSFDGFMCFFAATIKQNTLHHGVVTVSPMINRGHYFYKCKNDQISVYTEQ